MAILKHLSSLSLGNGTQRLNITCSSVDLPLSLEVFKNTFPVQYTGQCNFKATLGVSELDIIFGKNWHTFHFPNSNTRKRIIGLVMLHYRKKKITKFPIPDSR